MSNLPSKVQEDACEIDLYQKSMRALHKAGKVSDMHKPAETQLEKEFMLKNDTIASRILNTIPYHDGQYEKIFGEVTE